MSTISQTIPSYNKGISQQPDSLKLPGQLNIAQNVLPDITEGLQKRPGGRLIKSLSDDTTAANNSVADGKWFSYYRDEAEQYIGQIGRDGAVRMWGCNDGLPRTVTYGAAVGVTGDETSIKAYLEHYLDSDLQPLTLNDYTYVCNRAQHKSNGSTIHDKTTVDMAGTTAPTRPPEAYIELQKISYASQYSLNLFDNDTPDTTITTATRIKVEREYDSSNGCSQTVYDGNGEYDSGGTLAALPTQGYRCTVGAGDDRDSYCPNVDTRIFNVNYNATGTASDGNQADNNPSIWKFTGAVQDTSGSGGTSDGSDRKNLYFRILTIGQSVPEGGNATNPNYNCRYTTTHDLLYGGEGWVTGDYFRCWMKNARYKITIEDHSTAKVPANLGAARPTPTPFDNETTITAESILGDVKTAIIAGGTFTDANITQIGNGLYVTRASGDFNISTGSTALLSVMTDSVNNVEDLPSQCKNGYTVKITNSVEEEDDWYVKFEGKAGKDGSGVWVECNKPGRKIEFDKATMPIQIVRQANGSFDVSQIPWEDSLVGDENTNGNPSFVGKKINKMVFFRNRFALFADENIVLSQAGDFTNFWNKSALTFTNIDPIDLSCSSQQPAIIYDAIPVNTGLVLFTKTQQFMLTTDSDILSPNTAKINRLANYNFNIDTSPISLGTTVGWLDNAGKHSRFLEMQRTSREGEPEVVEQSKVVSKLFNKDLKLISNSRENGIVFFSELDSSTLYCYRYFSTSDKRIQQAWFTWTLPGTIRHHSVLDDALYIVLSNSNKDALLRYDIKMHDATSSIVDDKTTADTSDDVDYRVHLDNVYQLPSKAYKFTWNGSANYIDVYTTDNLGGVGTDVNLIFQPTLATLNATNGTTYEVKGIYSTDGFVRIGPTTAGGSVFDAGSANSLLNSLPAEGDNRFGYVQVNASNISSTDITTFMYDSIDNKSLTKKPDGFNNSDKSIYAFSDTGLYIKALGTTNIELTGDWMESTNTFIGYQFDYEVQFPTIYVQKENDGRVKSDMNASLVIHRVKLNLGNAGLYETLIERTGKPNYTETWEPAKADAYNASQVNILEEVTQTIPTYEKNTNLTLTLKSTHPAPATLYSMSWEGDFTNKFYQRV